MFVSVIEIEGWKYVQCPIHQIPSACSELRLKQRQIICSRGYVHDIEILKNKPVYKITLADINGTEPEFVEVIFPIFPSLYFYDRDKHVFFNTKLLATESVIARVKTHAITRMFPFPVLEESGLFSDQKEAQRKTTTESGVVSKLRTTLRDKKEMFPFDFVLELYKRAQDDVEIVLNSLFTPEEPEDKVDD